MTYVIFFSTHKNMKSIIKSIMLVKGAIFINDTIYHLKFNWSVLLSKNLYFQMLEYLYVHRRSMNNLTPSRRSRTYKCGSSERLELVYLC